MTTLKVKADTRVKQLAGSIAHSIRNGENSIIVTAVGAGAVNQAVKGIIVARGFLAQEGRSLATVPAFDTVDVDGQEKTAIKFVVSA